LFEETWLFMVYFLTEQFDRHTYCVVVF